MKQLTSETVLARNTLKTGLYQNYTQNINSTSQRTESAFIIQASKLISFRELIDFYYKNLMNRINTLGRKYEYFLNATARGTYNYHCALKCLIRKHGPLALWWCARCLSNEEEWFAIFWALESESLRSKDWKKENSIVGSIRSLATWDRFGKWMWGLMNWKGEME